jgi:hypothetical protein
MGSMGAFLLHNPWIQFYLLFVAALMVINVICATTRQLKSAGKTSSVTVKTRTANGSRSRAA